MPRSARNMRSGVCYHIIVRGNNRRWIFRESKEKEYFLELLRTYSREYHIAIYHYCVMDNHSHLLMKSCEKADGISKMMQGVQMVYARSYKKENKLTGSLFEGRYKSYAVAKDEYLMECGRYIERNPIRARIVKCPGSYRWSSFRYYGDGIADELITMDPVYKQLSRDERERRELYRKYIGVERAYESIVDGYFERVTSV